MSGKSFVLVDLSVQLELKSLLRRLNQEVADGLRDGVSHVSDDQLEVSIDSSSDFSHEEVACFVGVAVVALESIRDLLTNSTVARVVAGRRSVLWLRDDVSPVLEVVVVVGEEVVLLTVDH